MPTYDRELRDEISAKLASSVGEKVFEAIFNCIMRGGKVEDCLKAGQEKMIFIPVPDPVPFKAGFIEIMTQYKTNLQNQIVAIEDVLKRLERM